MLSSNILSRVFASRTALLSGNCKYIWSKPTTSLLSQPIRLSHGPADTENVPSTQSRPASGTSTLIMGRVSSDRYHRVIKIGVPKHRLNERYLLYIREQYDIFALDEKDECKPGDWVLLREQKEPLDENVTHKVEKIIYTYGNYVDPTTGRRSFGLYYDDDYEKLEKIKIDL